MQTHILSHYYNLYIDLKTIKGIEFTYREIDVMACMLSGKATGSIGSILDISGRTIETHQSNIRSKIGCTSRNGIIEFIEQSNKVNLLRQHYQYLLGLRTFKQSLIKISKEIEKNITISLCVHKNEQKSVIELIKYLQYYLELAGIKAEISIQNKMIKFPLLPSGANRSMYIPYAICSSNNMSSFTTHINKSLEDSSFDLSSLKESKLTWLMFNKEKIPEKAESIDWVDFSKPENFYFSILELLEKFLPHINGTKIREELKEIYKLIQGPAENPATSSISEKHVYSTKHFTSIKIFNTRKNKFMAIGVFIMCALIVGALATKKSNEYINSSTLTTSIRSDLIIPVQTNLLKRPELINKMEALLQTKGGINTIALVGIVGMGGVGKTTLARYFGQLQNSSLVWELNAETKESLISSFKDLAQALAKTKEKKEELEFIKGIQDPEEKSKQVLSFVKNHLKFYPNWLLIYDNVDSFASIKKYFPQDAKVWGIGKVIITTRDSNIQNTSYISSQNIIKLGELSQIEALTLFSKILYNCEPEKLTLKQRKEALNFLNQIPSFPLDISVAAYYIKDTHITYRKYLEQISHYSKVFETIQTNLLREVTTYEKTRYAIIALSFRKLIELNSEFKELLLLICLLDSQSIPINFLEFYKGQIIINQFVHCLRKYSIITKESVGGITNLIQTFSLHRSTQDLGKIFLLRIFNEDEKRKALQKYVKIISSFYGDIKIKNYKNLTIIIPHINVLLKNLQICKLNREFYRILETKLLFTLGYAYLKGTSDFVQARKCLSQAYARDIDSQSVTINIKANLLKDLAYIYYMLGLVNESVANAEESMQLCKSIRNSNTLIVENLLILGYVHTYKNNFDKAKHFIESALRELTTVDNISKNELTAKIYDALAILHSCTYVNGSKSKPAIFYANKALELLNASNLFYKNSSNNLNELSCQIADTRITLGQIYNRMGNYKEAWDQGFKEALYITNNTRDYCYNHFSKSQLLRDIGEIHLRNKNLEKSKILLSESINIFTKISGEPDALWARTLRAEAYIRSGDLAKAYEDCNLVFNKKIKGSMNYSELLYFTTFYHAAFIKYKQNELKKSHKHFEDFLKGMKEFCKNFLDKRDYKILEAKGAFTVSPYNSNQVQRDIKKYLKQSVEIFAAIYNKEHPFVKDYIVSNYNKASKGWWIL